MVGLMRLVHLDLSTFCAIGLALLIGCGGGGGGGDTALPGPTNLAFTAINATTIHLTWVAPQDTMDGFYLEGRTEGGSYHRLHAGIYPAELRYADYYLENQVPDLGSVTFRIAAVVGGKTTAYSNETTWKAPVRPPSLIQASLSGAVVQVAWSLAQPSTGATLHLEELVSQADGTSGSWHDVPVAVGATSYQLTNPDEGAEYQYRLSLLRGSVPSETKVTDVVVIPLPAPVSLTAVSGIESIQLSWTNQSRTESRVVVLETTNGTARELATLPSGTTSYHWAPASPGVHSLSVAAGTYNRLYYSQTTQATSITLPSPGSVASDVLGDATMLTWDVPLNVPTWASIVVERADVTTTFTPLATLGRSVTSYTDRGCPAGIARYRIGTKGSFTPSYSQELRVLIAPSVNGLMALKTSMRMLDTVAEAWAGPDGNWWFAKRGDGWWTKYILSPKSAGTYERHDVTFASEVWFKTPIHIDSLGNPTVTYVEPHSDGTISPFYAAHWDGSQWNRIPLNNPDILPGVTGPFPGWITGPSSGPMVLWNSVSGIFQAKLIQGAWSTSERLDFGVPGGINDVVTDLDGRPYVVLYYYDTATNSGSAPIFHQNAVGGWDRLPDSPWPTDVSFAPYNGGLAALWRKTDSSGSTVSYWFSRWDGLSWSSPEIFLTIPNDNWAGLNGRMAAQPDGRRFAFVYFSSDFRRSLAIRRSDGTWGISLLNRDGREALGVNFTPAGKLRIVTYGDLYPSPYTAQEYFFYDEP